MAIYKIASLNYMTAGTNRTFLNMDTILGYELYKPVTILRNEEPYISAAAVSAYGEFQTVQDNWSSISNDVSQRVGGLDYIQSHWDQVKDEVSAVVLESMIRDMTNTPLSVLCSDIVTEQREGKWLKTEYLAREFERGNYTDNAMAAAQSSDRVLLNERQRYYSEFQDGHRQYIRLYPAGSDQQSIEHINEFNDKRLHVNRTFVLDTDLASRAQSEDDYDRVDSSLNVMTVDAEEVRGIIYPMYDMVDVHVKSAYKNSKSNLKSFDAKVTSKREDIYLPQLTQDPIGYCQIQSNAYMLTEATVQEPGMLESSLHLQRLSRDVARTYTVQIKSNEVKTYLYGKKKVSVSDGKGKISEVDVIDVESLPQSNLAGIRYNNITEFPQNDIQVGYSEGNEYGNMVRGKNAMDSKYNMSLRLKGRDISACGCRDYAGIGQFSGNQLYFKFYDNITYDGISSEDGVSLTQRQDGVFSYQKIECAYLNRYTSSNLHKTRFFSINILNTELNQYEGVSESDLTSQEKLMKGLYSQIMQDIGSAIREIVENLQPSHTQLYKVMFDG